MSRFVLAVLWFRQPCPISRLRDGSDRSASPPSPEKSAHWMENWVPFLHGCPHKISCISMFCFLNDQMHLCSDNWSIEMSVRQRLRHLSFFLFPFLSWEQKQRLMGQSRWPVPLGLMTTPPLGTVCQRLSCYRLKPCQERILFLQKQGNKAQQYLTEEVGAY